MYTEINSAQRPLPRSPLLSLIPRSLAFKYGFQSKMPASHPYQTGATCVQAYIDGQPKLMTGLVPASSLAAYNIPASPTNSLRVGYSGLLSSNGGDLFSGSVADLRIYSRALTPTQVFGMVLPIIPNAVNPVPSTSANSYLWACKAGYFGPTMVMNRTAAGSAWSTFVLGGASMTCSACAAGSYSLASSSSCTPCPAGTYGATVALTSAQCSGACPAGYYCPLGTASATSNTCAPATGAPGAGSNFFCPSGSAQPFAVSANFYSTPLSSSEWLRYAEQPCPPNRLCQNGLLYPAVDASTSCASALLANNAALNSVLTNIAFGPTFAATTPGWSSPTLNWTMSVTGLDPLCPAAYLNVSFNVLSTLSAQMFLGSTPVNAAVCPSGFQFTITASRSPAAATDSLVSPYFAGLATPQGPRCGPIFVGVINLFTAPAIQYCSSISVPERKPAGTKFGSVAFATSLNPQSQIVYSILSSTSSPRVGVTPPYTVDCNGTLTSSSVSLYSTASWYNLTLMVSNIFQGAILNSFCWLTVTVTPQPVPPTLTYTTFSIFDQFVTQPRDAFANLAGTLVGNVAPVDNNNVAGAFVNYTATTAWAVVDTPNAFAITPSGAISVAQNVLDATSSKSTFLYTANVSDAVSFALVNVTIIVLASPRPPIIFAQARSVNDSAAVGTALQPAIFATSPQQRTIASFSLTDPSGQFTINATSGIVAVTSASLAYGAYACTCLVTDSAGLTASAIITITVLETNKAPVWVGGPFSRTVAEGAISGSLFGLSVTATSAVSNMVAISYSVGPTTPQMWAAGAFFSPITINPATGQLQVAAVPGGVLMADRNATFSTAFTYTMTVTATNFGAPPLSASAQLSVLVGGIAPRLSAASVAIAANTTGGTVVLSLSAQTWTAYSSATLSYAVTSGNASISTAEGVVALAVCGFSLCVTASPSFNQNTKQQFVFTVQVSDSGTGLSSSATFGVQIGSTVNNVATFASLLNTSGAVLAGAVATISELAAPGTTVAQAVFNDVDSAALLKGMKSYSLSASTSPAFAINATSGMISLSLASLGQLDFLSQSSYALTVLCSDLSSSPLVGNASVTVNLVQQNRVQVAGFSGTPLGAASSPANSASAPPPALSAANDVAFSASGSTIVISGYRFGYTAARVLAGQAQVALSATFGPVTGAEYALTGCAMAGVAAGVAGGLQNITCSVPAGIGGNFFAVVTCGSYKSSSLPRLFSYVPPALVNVAAAASLPTAGGTVLTVTGTNLGPPTGIVSAVAGPVAPVLRLAYGQPGAELTSYLTAACTLVAGSVLSATCVAQPGVGGGLSFVLLSTIVLNGSTVTLQSSAPFAPSAPAVSYTAPAVASVGAPAAADTRGGGSFNLTGSNFGPLGTATLQATYGKDLAGLSQPVFRSTSCVVTVAHTGATCVMQAGIGAAFSVTLTVLNQASASIFTTLAYSAPQILSPFLAGSGITQMSTQGGTQVIISGNFFGPAGLLLSDGVTPVNPNASYGHPGALIYAAQGCIVSVAHTQLTCLSAPGTGAGLVWQAIVGGQTSAVMSNKTVSYAPPTISLYAGPGTLANTVGGEGVNVTGISEACAHA